MNYVELIHREAERIFGSKMKADHWLSQPIAGASGSSWLQAAHSKTGYELVKAELERLSHGFAC